MSRPIGDVLRSPGDIVAIGCESGDRIATSGGMGLDFVRDLLSGDLRADYDYSPPIRPGATYFVEGTPSYYAELRDGSRVSLTKEQYEELLGDRP